MPCYLEVDCQLKARRLLYRQFRSAGPPNDLVNVGSGKLRRGLQVLTDEQSVNSSAFLPKNSLGRLHIRFVRRDVPCDASHSGDNLEVKVKFSEVSPEVVPHVSENLALLHV